MNIFPYGASIWSSIWEMFPRRIPIKWDKGHMVWFRQLTSSLTCHGNSIEYYFASLSLNWSHVTASDNTELYVKLNRKFQFNANSYGMILAEEEPDAYPRSEKKFWISSMASRSSYLPSLQMSRFSPDGQTCASGLGVCLLKHYETVRYL